jgi:hypothetical protein
MQNVNNTHIAEYSCKKDEHINIFPIHVNEIVWNIDSLDDEDLLHDITLMYLPFKHTLNFIFQQANLFDKIEKEVVQIEKYFKRMNVLHIIMKPFRNYFDKDVYNILFRYAIS